MSKIIPITEMREAIPKKKRLLGMDPGTKTIGLALSDTTWMIATPLEIINRKKFKNDAERLQEIIDEHDVGGFVIGWPLNMDGSEGPRCQSTMAFSRNLFEKFPLPQALWDERLSSAAVERTLIDADSSRARRKEVIDKMAAAYILQGALHAI